MTAPSLVNFTALLPRFIRICFSRSGSPLIVRFILRIDHAADLDTARAGDRRENFDDVIDDHRQVEIDMFQIHGAGFDLGQVEHVVDQPE